MPCRVLLVIEEPLLADLLGDAVSEHGHMCQIVADEAEALRLLGRARFDVVVVDVDARATGRDLLLRRMRLVAAGARMVALVPCGGLRHGLVVDCDISFEKPLRLRQLAAVLDRAAPR